ncbi:helix-turn-helix domain-containing protein [Reichenbachiella sp.]|uniref:AlbA family DNA-binding domain-containing protein n=1 Tax=Reichenbachiella sp. TaxID=2184521 RepID=UPI003B5B1C9A
MDYSNLYFNKNLDELTIEDIREYFSNAKNESDKVEYKSFPPAGNYRDKFNGICKTICGFINSDGGLLIWGAPSGKIPEGMTEEIFTGELELIDRVFEKDTLISSISDRITPVPNSLRVKIIEENNSCLCVFEADKSEYAPHQFSNTYYMRMDGQTRPAPHHYIDALFKKITFPNLEGYIKIDQIQVVPNGYAVNISIWVFNFSALQNERNLLINIISDCGQFRRYGQPGVIQTNYKMDGHQLLLKNAQGTGDVLHFGAPFHLNEQLLFTTASLMDNENQGILVFTFGGRKSPLKASEYYFAFRNIDIEQPESIVTRRNENYLISDKQFEDGISKADQLSAILGR